MAHQRRYLELVMELRAGLETEGANHEFLTGPLAKEAGFKGSLKVHVALVKIEKVC